MSIKVEKHAEYRFSIVVERDEDGVYIASCPALQGCYTQGDTYEEAVENLKDMIRLHIEARREVGGTVPVEAVVDGVRWISELPPARAA